MDKFNLKKYLTEGKLTEVFAIDDEVILRGNSTDKEVLKVLDMRRMFGSNLMAYTVAFPNGRTAEYDETQLSRNPKTIDMDKVFMKGKMSDEEVEDLETRADDYFSEPLKEGVWAKGNPDDIKLFIRKIKEIKDDFYEVVGSDDVFDGLDQAIKGAEELSGIAKDNPNEKELNEISLTHGGYVELMDLDDHLDNIHYEFEKWSKGPSTEITDIEPAKEDLISYVVGYLRNSL